MSQFLPGFDKSFRAGADLNTSTSLFRAVYINSSQSVNIVNTTTVATNTVGILQRLPKSGTGSACQVRLLNATSKVYLNDTCSAGDVIIAGADGPVRGTALTQTANVTILGRALESSAVTGTIIEIMLGNARAYRHPDTTTSNFILD